MFSIRAVKNKIIKKIDHDIGRSIRFYSNKSNNNKVQNSFLDSLDWEAPIINTLPNQPIQINNKYKQFYDNNNNNNNNNNSNQNNINHHNNHHNNYHNNNFFKIKWSNNQQKLQHQQQKLQQKQEEQQSIENDNSKKNDKKYYNNITGSYKGFTSSSISIQIEETISRRKLKEFVFIKKKKAQKRIKNNNYNSDFSDIYNSNNINSYNINSSSVPPTSKIYTSKTTVLPSSTTVTDISTTSTLQTSASITNSITPNFDKIIKCNERFKFILDPTKLNAYDVVLVYNRIKKRIYLDFISVIDTKKNKMLLSENNEYLINEIMLCFPLSPLRKNFELLFKELIESLSEFKGMNQQQHDQINNLMKKIKKVKRTVRKENLFGSFDLLYRELLVFLNECYTAICNSQFESHSTFFNKYSSKSSIRNGSVINGLKIIGDHSDWSDQFNVQIRNEVPISEGAALFYSNTYYKSKWSDLLSYFYFVSSLEYFPFYQLSSPSNFCFISNNDEIFSNIQMLENMSETESKEREKFFKYCIDFLVNGHPNQFKLNNLASSIFKDSSIKLEQNNNNNPPFPSLYISLLKKYYTETQCIERYNNYETKLIYSTLLEPIGINKSSEIKLLLSYLLSKFKSTDAPKNEITFINNPKININKNIKDSIINRKVINETSILLEEMDSSITLGERNLEDGSISLSINIPDFTDLIPEKSSLDTWCMLKSLNYELSNGEVCRMIPNDIYSDIRINGNKNDKFISIFMKFNNRGYIIDYSITPTLINNTLEINNNSINNLIQNENIDNSNSQENELIKKLVDFTKVINSATRYSTNKLNATSIQDVIKEFGNHVIAKYSTANQIEIPLWIYKRDFQLSNSTSKLIKIITCDQPSPNEISENKGTKFKNQSLFVTPNSNIVSPLTNYLDLFVLRKIKNYIIQQQQQQQQQNNNNNENNSNNNNSNNNNSLSKSFTKDQIRNIIIPYLNFKYMDKKI